MKCYIHGKEMVRERGAFQCSECKHNGVAKRVSEMPSESYMIAREELQSAIQASTKDMNTKDFKRLMDWLIRQAKRYKSLQDTPEP